MNRRKFLLTSTAALAAGIPSAASCAHIAGPLPGWAVGPPDGEMNWVSALGTEHQAKIEWLWSHLGLNKCEHGGEFKEGCECEFCENYGRLETMRQPLWDGKQTVSRGDWLRAGLGSICSRCDYETYADNGGYAIGDEAVCEECMTLADWEIVDPERAAEIRADMAEDETALIGRLRF